MTLKSRPAIALLSLSLAAIALTGCSEEAAGGSDVAGDAGSCAPEDVQLVGQVRNESNPYEASWLDGGDAFAASVGLEQNRLTYDGDSTKQQEQVRQLLAGDTSCLVMNVLPNGDSDTTPIVKGADQAGAYVERIAELGDGARVDRPREHRALDKRDLHRDAQRAPARGCLAALLESTQD